MKIKDETAYINAVKEKQKLEKTAVGKRLAKLNTLLSEYDRERVTNSIAANEVKVPEPLSFTEQVVKERIDKITELMLVKGREYVRGNDRLHNFRRTAESQRISMPEALHGFLMKHITSYFDMIDDIKADKQISDKVIDEKLGDIVVYILLQEAVIKTHNKEKLFLPPTEYATI